MRQRETDRKSINSSDFEKCVKISGETLEMLCTMIDEQVV